MIDMHFSYTKTIKTETKPLKPWQEKVIGLLFFVIGIALLIYSYSTITEYKEKDSSYIETTSVVVDYDYDSDGLQAIIVEYTVEGVVYRKTSNTYSNNPKDVGSEVSIKYNPTDPNDMIWTNDSTNVILPVCGVLFSVVGAVVLITSLRKKKEQVVS